MRLTTGAWLAAAGLLLAGCSSSGGDAQAKASKSASPSASASASSSPELSAEWLPKLKGLGDGGDYCETPNTAQCAERIKKVLGVAEELEAAIEGVGRGHYIETLGEIAKMQAAATDYRLDDCDRVAVTACWTASARITLGPVMLRVALGVDEDGPGA